MADFGGFEVKTPQEVLKEIAATQAQVAQIRDPRTRRDAMIQNTLATAFGSRELRQAQQTYDNIKSVEREMRATELPSGVKQGSPEAEKIRLTTMFDAVAKSDPMAAAQISSRLTQLDAEIFERNRLSENQRIQQQRLQLEESREQRELIRMDQKNPFDAVVYYQVPKPGRSGEYDWEAVDLDNAGAEEQLQAMDEAGYERFTQDQMFEMQKAERDAANKSAAGGFDMNNSDWNKVRQGLEASYASNRRANSIMQILGRNPDANTDVARFEQYITGLGQEAQAVLEFAPGMNETKAREIIDRTLGENFQVDGMDREEIQALTLNLAYAMARQLDPSGRLSDADVMFAGRMLGRFLKNPKAMSRVLTSQLARASEQQHLLMEGIQATIPQEQWDGNVKLMMWYDKKRQDSFMEYGRTVVGNGFMTQEDWEAMVRGDPLPDTDANDPMGAESKARRSRGGVSLSDFD
jgi:hypothetical protein